MGIIMLVTSSLMANLYNKFCDYFEDYPIDLDLCGEDDDYRDFLVLPVFGYFTMLAWVRYKSVSVNVASAFI